MPYTLCPMAHESDPIKVLLYSFKGSGLHYGGPGMTAYRLYSKARPGAFELTLLHGHRDQADYDLFTRQVRVGTASNVRRWTQAIHGMQLRRWVAANVREFDVLHGLQGFMVTTIAAVEAEKQGVPAVVKLAAHDSDLADKGGWRGLLGLPRKRRELLKSKVSAVIAISGMIEDELRGYGFPDSKIVRIPNGVDIDQFRPAVDAAEKRTLREELGAPVDEPIVFFSGIMDDRKRPHLLIEGDAAVRRAGLSCQYIFAGHFFQPEYEARFHAAVKEAGIEDRVTLLGFTDSIAAWYRASDVYVLPSRSEGMPNALMEAMASGLPSIATAISGVTDLIEDDVQGRLVEPTPESVGAALAEYVGDAERREAAGRAARDQVVRSYSAAAVAQMHEDLFRRVMSGRPAAG